MIGHEGLAPTKNILKLLPQVDHLLRHPSLIELRSKYPRKIVLDAAREALADVRKALLNGSLALEKSMVLQHLLSLIQEKIEQRGRPSFRRVINATGVVIHTNLGRSPLSQSALRAIMEICGCYSNLEYSLERGERDERLAHIEGLLTALTGAEAALAVNNNAGAVLLVLNTLAEGKEVIVSRGELVEIGGSFRIPEIMEKSGVSLIEVGTTNRTRREDYERAIAEKTALLLKVHRSNFEIRGFTEEVSLKDLVRLGHSKDLLVMEDLGSGCLVDLSSFGLRREPTVKETLREGADVVTFSGDKLFGGPQAGIILGKKDICARLHKNPLYRTLRIDKFTLTALEATARLYLDPQRAIQDIPTLRILTEPLGSISRRARSLAGALRKSLTDDWDVDIVDEVSEVGGGALPMASLPTRAIALFSRRISPDEVERLLRSWDPPIIGRVSRGKVLLDMRTVTKEEVKEIARALGSLTKKTGGNKRSPRVG